MASDSTGLYIFGFILLLIVGIFAYSFLSNRLATDKRKQLRTFMETHMPDELRVATRRSRIGLEEEKFDI